MGRLRVLNLYCGLGGNRKLWKNCNVTAIEYDEEIAQLYKLEFPQDNVIITDAHQYLLDHFQEFDFIWASPPCQSHSRVNAAFNAHGKGNYQYPDMRLYQEITLLKHFAKCKWVIENVIPYYKPLVEANAIRDRHLFWSNFHIDNNGRVAACDEPIAHVKVKSGRYGFSLDGIKIKKRKDQLLRNCVDPEVGLYILNCAFKTKQTTLV